MLKIGSNKSWSGEGAGELIDNKRRCMVMVVYR